MIDWVSGLTLYRCNLSVQTCVHLLGPAGAKLPLRLRESNDDAHLCSCYYINPYALFFFINFLTIVLNLLAVVDSESCLL